MRILLVLIALFISSAAYAFTGLVNPYTSFPPSFPELTAIAGLDVQMDYDATNTDSYAGSGTVWTNRIGANCDLTVVSATFTGTAGNASAYWDTDASQYFYCGNDINDETQNPAFIDNVTQAGQDTDWWVTLVFNTGDSTHAGGGQLFGSRYNSDDLTFRAAGLGEMKVDDTNGTTSTLDEDFKLIPNTDLIITLSYDDSADTLYTFFNSLEAYTETVSLFHNTNTPTKAFSFFSNGVTHHGFTNLKVYALAGGAGLMTDAQHAEVVAAYNARHNRTYAPTAGCTGEISDCIPGVVFELLANDSDSYAGSGTTITNVQEFPADQATQTAYDGEITSLAFAGSSGVAGASFYSTNGDGYITVDIDGANTPWAYGMAESLTPEFAHSWCAVSLRTPAAWPETGEVYLFGNAPRVADDQTGWGVAYDHAGTTMTITAAQIPTMAGSGYEDHAFTTTLEPNTDYFIQARSSPYDCDGCSGAASISQGARINSTTIAGISNNFENSGSPYTDRDQATGDFILMGTYDNTPTGAVTGTLGYGARLYAAACGRSWDHPALARRILEVFEVNADLDFDNNGTKGGVGAATFQNAARARSNAKSTVLDGGLTVSGMRIEMQLAAWHSLQAIAIVDSTGDNVMADLTRVAYVTTNDFTSIVAGEYTTDSDYNQTIIHTWDDSNIHWNDGNTIDHNVYVEFSSAINLSEFHYHINNNNYTWPTFIFYDDEGNTLTPATAPTDKTDTNGDATVDGVTATETYKYKWTF